MSKKVNKKIDNIERFLSNFWKIFPNLTSTTLNEDFNGNVIQPFLQNSLDFCQLLKDNIILFYGRPLGSGANGTVGTLGIIEDDNLEQVYGIIISRKEKGGFEPFYVPLILKNTIQPKNINIWQILPINKKEFTDPRLNYIFSLSNPISEIIFGGMVSFLYDSGICPGFTKNFGSYACLNSPKNPDMYNISIITEKANITFGNLLKRVKGPGSDPLISDQTLCNLLFQFIYTVYVGKYYLGFSHYDTHLENIMFTYLNNTINIPGQIPTDYIYKGEKINNKKYIIFKHPVLQNGRECFIVIKNQGLLLKIIDYGACASYLYTSQSEIIRERIGGPPIDFAIIRERARQTLVSGTAFERGVNFPSVRNTHEIEYLLINLYEYITKGMDVIFNTSNPVQPYSDLYSNFLTAFSGIFFDNDINGINNVRNVISRDPVGCSMHKIPENKNAWYNITRNRDVGLEIPAFDDPNELLNGLIRFCKKLNHTYNFQDNNKTFYYLENDINPLDISDKNSLLLNPINPIDNTIYNFIKSVHTYQIPCNNGVESSCKKIDKWDPNTTLEKPLLSSTKMLFNPEGKLDHMLLRRNLNNYLREGNEHLKIYSIQINPSGVGSSKTDPDDFVYRTYQQWMNFKNITDKNDEYMPTVHVNISILNPVNMKFLISSKYNCEKSGKPGGLWEISQDKYVSKSNTYFITNGGYFTINSNIENQMFANILVKGASLNPMEIFNPIGFYYNKDDIKHSGTTIPVPKPYRNYFAFVTKRNNVLAIENYNDFYSQFKHVKIPLLYELEDGTFYATTQDIIEMRNGLNNTYGGNPVLRNNSLLDPNDINLEFAFCSGPLLVRDGIVVFDFNTMINKQFAIVDDDIPNFIQPRGVATNKPPNLTSYKIIYGHYAHNNYMFNSGENTDTNQMYGMRHSNRLMVHNV